MTDGSSVVLMLRMALSLVIVLAAIFALARFVQRRQLGGGRLRQNGAVQVRVVARTTLSRNASVQVVEIGSHTLVLGVTDSTVNVLGDVPIADLIVDPEARPSPAPTNSTMPSAFDAVLSRVSSGSRPRAAAAVAEGPPQMHWSDVLHRRGRHRG